MSREVEIVDDSKPSNNSHEVAVREERAIAPAQEKTADEIIARLDKIREVQKRAMDRDVDYGVIPGTERKDKDGKDISKPTLLKPGAEKLCVLFNLDAQFNGDGNSEQIIVEQLPDGTKIRHMLVKRYCTIYSQVSGARLGGASAVCTTLESKYAYRKAARICPNCKKENIRRSKQADNDGDQGWYCWAKMGGCGAKFRSDDAAITGQVEGRVPNVDVADQYNTCIRLGEKRALVAAVRQVTGASAIFDEEWPDIEGERHREEETKDAGPKTSETKTHASTQKKTEKAADPAKTQGMGTSEATNPATSQENPDGGDSGADNGTDPREEAAKAKVGKVTPEQAAELTELFGKTPLAANQTREQKLFMLLKMVSAKGDMSDVPAPNFKVMKQILEKQIADAAKAAAA